MSEPDNSDSDIYLQDDLVFESGKKYLIKSNSGNGKSSFLNFIFQSNLNFTGSIKYLNINNDNLIYLRRNKLSYVFQDFKLFPELNIIENLRLKNNLTEYKSDQELLDLIEKVDLINKKDSLIRELSLGQRQRVAIIRSLCQPFSFLLLDEPFSHLDDSNIEILTNLIDQELESRQAGMILTTLNNEYLFSYDKKINL